MSRPVVPVEVGQLRRDPDPRMAGRVVRVVDLGSRHRNLFSSVLVESVASDRKTRIRLSRLERWEVVP